MKNVNGFTLIESMIAIAIIAILLSLGVPSFVQTVQNNELTTSANTIVTALHTARSEAVKRHARVTVCRSTAGSCSASGDDLLIFANTLDDASFDADDELVADLSWLNTQISIVSDDIGAYVSYSPSGFARAIGGSDITGSLVLCDDRGNDHARVLSLAATGRPQIRDHAEIAGAPSCVS